MIFKATPTFAKAFKKLKKKYRNLGQDIDRLRSILTTNSNAGIPLGSGLYKIRLASSDIHKGKSGTFRVIYYLMLQRDRIVFLDIYTKSEKGNVPMSAIRKILDEYLRNE